MEGEAEALASPSASGEGPAVRLPLLLSLEL